MNNLTSPHHGYEVRAYLISRRGLSVNAARGALRALSSPNMNEAALRSFCRDILGGITPEDLVRDLQAAKRGRLPAHKGPDPRLGYYDKTLAYWRGQL